MSRINRRLAVIAFPGIPPARLRDEVAVLATVQYEGLDYCRVSIDFDSRYLQLASGYGKSVELRPLQAGGMHEWPMEWKFQVVAVPPQDADGNSTTWLTMTATGNGIPQIATIPMSFVNEGF